MARAISPTLKQKELMTANNLLAKNWLVIRETETEVKLISKTSGKKRTIKKSA